MSTRIAPDTQVYTLETQHIHGKCGSRGAVVGREGRKTHPKESCNLPPELLVATSSIPAPFLNEAVELEEINLTAAEGGVALALLAHGLQELQPLAVPSFILGRGRDLVLQLVDGLNPSIEREIVFVDHERRLPGGRRMNLADAILFSFRPDSTYVLKRLTKLLLCRIVYRTLLQA